MQFNSARWRTRLTLAVKTPAALARRYPVKRGRPRAMDSSQPAAAWQWNRSGELDLDAGVPEFRLPQRRQAIQWQFAC